MIGKPMKLPRYSALREVEEFSYLSCFGIKSVSDLENATYRGVPLRAYIKGRRDMRATLAAMSGRSQ